MSFETHVLYNTLERALSTDLTRGGRLAGTALLDTLIGLSGGVGTTAPPNPTLRGLGLRLGAGLNVILEVGSFLRYDTGSIPTDGSAYRLGVLRAEATLLMTADPALPRVARISIAEVSQDTDSTNRDIFDPATQTFVSTPVPKTRRASSAVTITLGTPATNPLPPATPAGQVVLWDVYIAAAAVGLNASHLMDARVPFSLEAFRARTAREGLIPYVVNAGGTTLGVRPGQLQGRGVVSSLDVFRTLVVAGSDLLMGGALAANTTYYVYAVARGNDSPMGTTVVARLAFILSTLVPTADGSPPSAITYPPLQGVLDQASGGPRVSTTAAYAIGTVTTDAGATLVTPAGGLQLGRDPATMIQAIDPATGGLVGGVQNYWMREARFEYVDANTVRLASGIAIIRGVPYPVSTALSATLPGSLIAGEADAPETWYYVYARLSSTFTINGSGGRRTLSLRLTTEAPDANNGMPTPEAGFASSDYVYVGSFWNDYLDAIQAFDRVGNRTTWRDSAAATIYSDIVPYINGVPDIVDTRSPETAVTACFELIVSSTPDPGASVPLTRDTGVYILYDNLTQSRLAFTDTWATLATTTMHSMQTLQDVTLEQPARQIRVAASEVDVGATNRVRHNVVIRQNGYSERL